MQPRLMRSRTESIVAGVCGGIGEYFAIDPVIVRLIFVLIGLTTWGLGFLMYPVLALIMPKAAAPLVDQPQPSAQPALGARADEVAAREVLRASAAASQQRRPATTWEAPAPGPTLSDLSPEIDNFDPWTGAPLRPGQPMIGETQLLQGDQPAPPSADLRRPRRRNSSLIGILLIGIGLMGIASAFGIPSAIVLPLLLIAGGVALLRRR